MQHRVLAASILTAAFIACGVVAHHADALTGGPAGTATMRKPDLSVQETVDTKNLKPGDTVTVTLTVTNHGTGDAPSLTITDVLPAALILPDGSHTYHYALSGMLGPDESVTTAFTATVRPATTDGTYRDATTVTATLADTATTHATVTVSTPRVLGASTTLPSSGAGQLDVFLMLLGVSLVCSGIVGLLHTVRP